MSEFSIEFGDKVFRQIIDRIGEGVYILDKERKIHYWNKAAENITGYLSNEVNGLSCSHNILTHVDECGKGLCDGHCPIAATMNDGKARENKVFLHHKDGHRVPVMVKAQPLLDEEGNIIGGIEAFSDISHQDAHQMQIKILERIALLDALTQLANRHFLEKELEGRLDEIKQCGAPFGVIFMDIDYFKDINDKFGHETGDVVIKLVANTLISNCRPFDLFGRWGGDEFMGIIRNIDEINLQVMGNRLRALVEKSYTFCGTQKLSVTLSMGASIVHGEDSVKTIFQRIDRLLYESKTKGRNCLTFGL